MLKNPQANITIFKVEMKIVKVKKWKTTKSERILFFKYDILFSGLAYLLVYISSYICWWVCSAEDCGLPNSLSSSSSEWFGSILCTAQTLTSSLKIYQNCDFFSTFCTSLPQERIFTSFTKLFISFYSIFKHKAKIRSFFIFLQNSIDTSENTMLSPIHLENTIFFN